MPNPGSGQSWNQRFFNWSRRASTWIRENAAFLTSLANLALVWLIYQQNQGQKLAADRLWSAQQVQTLFELSNCEGPRCWPKANARSREDAVRAYTATEGHSGNARLARANLIGMSLVKVDLSNVDFSEAELQFANLTGADLSNSTLIGVNLQEATVRLTDLTGAKLAEADLRGADLTGANLEGAGLEKAMLGACRDVDWGTLENTRSAILRDADLRGAKLTDASLCGIDISGADLRGAIDLDPKALKRTVGDERTQLPDYIRHRPKKWKASSIKAALPARARLAQRSRRVKLSQ